MKFHSKLIGDNPLPRSVSLLLELSGRGSSCGGGHDARVGSRIYARLSVGRLKLGRHAAVEVRVARGQGRMLGRCSSGKCIS